MTNCNEPVRIKCLGCGTAFSEYEWLENSRKCPICDHTFGDARCTTCNQISELVGPGVYRLCCISSTHSIAVNTEAVSAAHDLGAGFVVSTIFDVFYNFDATNPFTLAIQEHKNFSKIRTYLFSSQFISGVFLLLFHLIVLAVSTALWPWGLLYSCSIMMGRKSASAVTLLKSSTSGAEFVAHGLSLLLIYLPVFIILLVLSAPVFGINYCAKAVSRDPRLIGVTFAYIVLGLIALCVIAVLIGVVIGLVVYVLLPLALIALIVSIFKRD